MDIGNQIVSYRKSLKITQEQLAQQLGVTNQAVSKWESDQCCPDVQLLPKLADIFGITIDELFGRQGNPVSTQLPWEDDETLRVVLYIGHKQVTQEEASREITFRYEGGALNVESAVSVACGDVVGNVKAGTDLHCGDVQGDVKAGTDINCGDVYGDIRAGTHVQCGNIQGSVKAGTDLYCGNVGGKAHAGCSIFCGNVGDSAVAEGDIICGRVGTQVKAGCTVTVKEE